MAAKRMSEMKRGVDAALEMLRSLPRIGMTNITYEPGSKRKIRLIRGQKARHHMTRGEHAKPMRLGYDASTSPWYLKFQQEHYYRGHHLRREYMPMSLRQLQLMVDTGRLDTSMPVDLAQIFRTKLFRLDPRIARNFGIQLTDEGLDDFRARINVEVQYAPEHVIAAVERNGGFISTAYYDVTSLTAMADAEKYFRKGLPVPRRMLPPADAVEYYSDPKNRGYLADPAEIARERVLLAQKYGYTLRTDDVDDRFLGERKHPRQVFFGLEPGWVVSLRDSCIFKPADEEIRSLYQDEIERERDSPLSSSTSASAAVS